LELQYQSGKNAEIELRTLRNTSRISGCAFLTSLHRRAEFDDRIACLNVDPGSRTTPSAAPLPHQKLAQNEIRKRIDEAIARLSPEHRAVILMKEMEDLQYNEIAEMLNWDSDVPVVLRAQKTPDLPERCI